MQNNRLLINTITSLLLKVITIVCGFILPQLMLKTFGSAVNGLINSIAQFLTVISFLELGIGSVVQTALYKPLAKKDAENISKIVSSAHKFFRRLAIIFVIYVAVLIVVYPTFVDRGFGFGFTATLILIISINSFAQNYLGIVDGLLISADQYGYIRYTLQIAAMLLNTVLSVILIKCGCSVHVVKGAAACVHCILPVCQRKFVRKHYQIDTKITYDKEPIAQKWNGIAQHIAAVVLDSTDNIVLTVFSTLENVSIYSVYHLVVFGIKQLVGSLTNGVQAHLGELWAKQEKNELVKMFEWTEWTIHTVTIFVFGCTTMLITPFVRVYTAGVTDANYIQPLFGVILSLANALHCLRYPYSIMVHAAGHFKQTQRSYIVSTVLNLVISIVAATRFGLIGVAIGTLIGMLYHTIWLAYYTMKNLLHQSFHGFFKQVFIDTMSFGLAAMLSQSFGLNAVNYFAWVVLAIKVAFVWLGVIIVVNFFFYHEKMAEIMRIKK